jgi:hypothetical protein
MPKYGDLVVVAVVVTMQTSHPEALVVVHTQQDLLMSQVLPVLML